MIPKVGTKIKITDAAKAHLDPDHYNGKIVFTIEPDLHPNYKYHLLEKQDRIYFKSNKTSVALWLYLDCFKVLTNTKLGKILYK